MADGLVTPSGDKTVLIVGLGGLGCPVALVLARAGVGRLLLCDDDVVDETNLHRQILFGAADIGQDKLDVAARSLTSIARESGTQIELVRSRLLPDNARALVSRADVVVEGADNFATKFLAADACYLERRPVVHGAAIRWIATAWAVGATGQPCYRCLFEDLPARGAQPNCDTAGVMGPVVGLAGAIMAELALRVLNGRACEGQLWTLDGKTDRLREMRVHPRASCALCGPRRSIVNVDESRYSSGTRAA
jgi:molybdopterin/thiamine biosynthesis adenylyltransferase